MNDADAARIRRTLEALRQEPRAEAVFGARFGHRFHLNPVITPMEIALFEQRHGVTLPADYAWFLSVVGNGGAGPFYGIFPLGCKEGRGNEVLPFSEDDDFVGKLSEPFPHHEPWNDLSCMPDDDLAEQNEGEDRRRMDIFDDHYWNTSLINGAIPICELGCALRIWLVVTGDERGNLWQDNRAEYGGLVPLASRGKERISFLLWYEAWLKDAISKASCYI